MTEPIGFFESGSPISFECASCGLVRVITFDDAIKADDRRSIKRGALACMGWIAVANNNLACQSCTEVLRDRLISPPREERLSIQSALAEQLFASRILVR